ncbi:MAG: KH domain-containing protein [Candidatus Woesearchaeota archaeon]
MYIEEIKVPKDRIAVIIGKSGETKTELEETTKCSINVDSVEGDVKVSSENSIDIFVAKDVIKAIARGFNPEIAKKLVDDTYAFQLITLNDYSPHKNHQERLKGRVIGRDGKARNLIEEYTECSISVYGKTVGIIGKAENVQIAYKAVDSLLGGSPHAFVYKWLEKQRALMVQDQSPF